MTATTSTDASPRALPRVRALDGLRGLAVAGVLAYHLGYDWMPGGFLGVSLFFTLSGFLITSLLLVERGRSGTIRLGAFWGRRFRRLLPAAWAGIGLAVLFTAFAGDPDQLRKLPGDVVGGLADVANWRFLIAGDPYLAGYQLPSPLLHYWSLAIEEQFYLLFPLVVFLLVRRRVSRRGWFLLFGGALVASMVWTLVRFDPTNTTLVYFDTMCRIAELLAGVLLALALEGWWSPSFAGLDRLRALDPRAGVLGRVVVPLLAVAATLGLWVLAHTADEWIYRGGLWLVAALSCLLVVSTFGDGPVARTLGTRGLVGLGLISYGVYVYHWPIFLWLSPERTGLGVIPLSVLRLAATFGLALVSYRFFEQPIRRGQLALPGPAVAAIGVVGAALLLVVGFVVGQRADDRAVAAAVTATTAAPLVTRPPISSPLGTAPTGTTPGSAVAAKPTKVLFLGDSLLHQAYPVIDKAFEEHGIETKAIGGPGQTLLRHDAAWLAELDQALAEFQPDVVVMESCCGHGDTKDLYHDARGTALEPDTDEQWQAWEDTAGKAVDAVQDAGALPLWVLAPPAETNGYYGPIEHRIDRANEIAIDLAESHPGLGLVDWRVLSAPDGSYSATLPDANGNPVTVRAGDGLHFTPEGQALLADLTRSSVEDAWTASH